MCSDGPHLYAALEARDAARSMLKDGHLAGGCHLHEGRPHSARRHLRPLRLPPLRLEQPEERRRRALLEVGPERKRHQLQCALLSRV